MKLSLTLAATLLAGTFALVLHAQEGQPPATNDDTVILTVDGTPITQGEMRKTFMARFGRQMQQMPEEQRQAMMPQIQQMLMSSLISKALLLNEAEKRGIEASAAEIAESLEKIVESLPAEVTMEQFAQSAGMELEQIRAQIAEDIKVQTLVEAVTEDVDAPADGEVKEFYDENTSQFEQEASVEASHILLSTRGIEDEAQIAEKKAEAEKLRQQLIDGEGKNFAELAQAHSDCPSKAQGGSLGEFGTGRMVPEFEKAAFSQEVGAIGEVVETDFGFHIIQVTGKTDAKTLSYDEVKDRLREQLLEQAKSEKLQSYIGELREAATIEQPGAPESPAE